MQLKRQIKVEIVPDMRVSLDVRLKDDYDGTKNILTLYSVVEELLEGDGLLIQMPMYQSYYYPMPRDEIIQMKFIVAADMYEVDVLFEERVERDGLMFARMRRVGNIEELQQRDCYRLRCCLPVTVEYVPSCGEDSEICRIEARIINLSDGGMLLGSDKTIERGETVTLTFDIGRAETVSGIVLRAEKVEDGNYLFRVAVRLEDCDRLQRQRIYKYIVDSQLEERRRWVPSDNPH